MAFIEVIERSDHMASCFQYELTPEPTSLFKDGFIRKSKKSVLSKALIKDSKVHTEMRGSKNYVFDGRALLHRLYWNLPIKYRDIIDPYSSFMTGRYG